ncbi:hypothetical protein [Rhodococcus sovatensis]|uniref:Ribulose-phosphate 3-epimerase n=1 Tax=Rhodococcus sovatensis TaxID=1805840 RepID=A0ABZ2PI42_9NOCA
MSALPRPGGSRALEFNVVLAERFSVTDGAELAGSLFAVPERERAAAAAMLSDRGIWIHADVFPDADMGVSLDLITRMVDDGIGPVDVHLLSVGALDALDVVCRPGIARVTLPFEGIGDVESSAWRVRTAGARPWLAVSPGTPFDDYRQQLQYVDGVLVMLIEPGTKNSADLTQLTKLERSRQNCTTGVDGGVDEENLGRILAAGTEYVVIGRRLFTNPKCRTEGERL